MKAYGAKPDGVQEGIAILREGTLRRVYFDIRRREREQDESAGDTMRTDPENDWEMDYVDVADLAYGTVVSAIVNDRYSADDVQAILANHTEAKDDSSVMDAEKREEYLAEYAEFQAWRKKAKEVAKAVAP